MSGLLLILLIIVFKLIYDRWKKNHETKHAAKNKLNSGVQQQNKKTTKPLGESYHYDVTAGDSFLDHSCEGNEAVESNILQYNLHSLSRPPTLSRPTPSTLSRVRFGELSTNTYRSDPVNIHNINNYYG